MAKRLLPLLIGAILILAPSNAAAEAEYRQEFLEDAMVSGASGWARTYAGLYWTDDGGASWRNITPASAHPGRLQAVAFADPEHGWAAAEEGDEPHPRSAFYATSDGGHTWTRTPIRLPGRYAQVGDASFSAVGAHLVFPSSANPATPPITSGTSTSATTGAATGASFRSSRPTRVRSPSPAPATAGWPRKGRNPPSTGPATAAGAGRKSGCPVRRGSRGRGPTTSRRGSKPTATASLPRRTTTTNAGRSRPSMRPPTSAATGRSRPRPGSWSKATRWSSPTAATTRCSPRSTKRPSSALLSVDGSASPLAGTGLPTEYSPWLSFSGSEDGFGRIETERCHGTGTRARCTDVNGLYFSADGGASWTPTSRP